MAKKVLIFPLSHWGSFQSGQKDSRLCICWLTGKSVSAIHPVLLNSGCWKDPVAGCTLGNYPVYLISATFVITGMFQLFQRSFAFAHVGLKMLLFIL